MTLEQLQAMNQTQEATIKAGEGGFPNPQANNSTARATVSAANFTGAA